MFMILIVDGDGAALAGSLQGTSGHHAEVRPQGRGRGGHLWAGVPSRAEGQADQGGHQEVS